MNSDPIAGPLVSCAIRLHPIGIVRSDLWKKILNMCSAISRSPWDAKCAFPIVPRPDSSILHQMFKQEAEWFADQLEAAASEILSPMANIGAQSAVFRTMNQSFIDRLIFDPIKARGIKVINVDIVPGDGIDVACDVTDQRAMERLRVYKFKSIFCSNLLEHIQDRGVAIENIQSLLEPGGQLYISCPYRFPYHPDPIDTMYRPNTSELAMAFNKCQLIESKIVACGTFPEHRRRSLAATVIRLSLPCYRPMRWLDAARHIPYLISPYQATCVVLRKVA